MNDTLNRLRRMRELQSHHAPPVFPFRQAGTPQVIEDLARGTVHTNELGLSYSIPTAHDSDHRHGGRLLTDWLAQDLAGAASFTGDDRLADADPRRCLFLDTETTGLASSAGTLVFLVGVGYFTADGFEVRQFFLRDPAEEPAMLRALHSLMCEHDAVVTFNGRSFDMPLLAQRFILNRQRVSVDKWANLDLLFPARRLWKRRLDSCRLANLELQVLNVERTADDVPGMLIPQMYQDYVHTRDARDIMRVVYHNLIDVLSMVTLGAQICETFSNPTSKKLHSDDWLSLARWYEKLCRPVEAESAYSAALNTARLDSEMVMVFTDFANFYKKQGRPEAAAEHWESWAALQPKAVEPRLELAKYYEWTVRNLRKAAEWTDAALAVARSWGASGYRETTITELTHRLDRLTRKL